MSEILAWRVSLVFSHNHKYFVPRILQDIIRLVIIIALILYPISGKMTILTLLSLPHPSAGTFVSFVSCSLSLQNVWELVWQSSFTSFVKFITKYLILFDATVNRIVFLISFSSQLFADRNANDFWMPVWSAAVVLCSFTVPNCCVEYWELPT